MNKKLCAASDKINCWEEINFQKAAIVVKKLQNRIAVAFVHDEMDRCRYLQNRLIHSFYAKALAVKIVTSNRGKNTEGTDGIIWKTPDEKFRAILNLNRRGYKPKTLKRVYIPKPDGGKRPLSIPTMKDRAMMNLYKMALEPIAEITADKGSFGFLHDRSAKDAIMECIHIFSRNARFQWILKADIRRCFDNISHDWLLEHIPMDKRILEYFLKCGYMDNSVLYPTTKGVPQGGSLSGVICNMTLDGLESVLKERFGNTVCFVRYADDFIIVGCCRIFLVQEVVPAVKKFLSERGLELSREKTVVANINDGFSFLGYKLYRYESKIITIPKDKKILSLLDKVATVVSEYQECKLSREKLIESLKSIIRGWLNYYNLAMIQSIHEAEFEVVSLVYKQTGDNSLAGLAGRIFAKFDLD